MFQKAKQSFDYTKTGSATDTMYSKPVTVRILIFVTVGLASVGFLLFFKLALLITIDMLSIVLYLETSSFLISNIPTACQITFHTLLQIKHRDKIPLAKKPKIRPATIFFLHPNIYLSGIQQFLYARECLEEGQIQAVFRF